MKSLSNIPRGLVVFLGAILVLAVLALGYRLFFAPSGGTGAATDVNGFFSSLFPFGGGNAPAGEGGTTAGQANTQGAAPSGPVPLLWQVSAVPVAGGWFATNPASTSTPLIRYMDRASGNVIATPTDSFTETRISNTTFPGVEALYAVSDSTFIASAFVGGKVQNFYGAVSAASSPQTLSTTPLRPADRIAVGGGMALSVTETGSGSRTDLTKPDGTKPETLLVSPVASWVPLIAAGRAFVETAPTASGIGYLYEIRDGALVKRAGGTAGFMASISPSGRYIVESSAAANKFSLAVIDTMSGATFSSAVGTLVTKCAWIPNHEPLLFCAAPENPPQGAYPDDWLLGGVSFSDDAWILSPATKTAYFIGKLADDSGVPLDAENISVSPGGTYALFMNRRDLSLWSLRISDFVARALGRVAAR